MIYIATAYRFGWLNGHQYKVYVGTDKAKAIALADEECNSRGGKYGVEVVAWSEDADGNMQSQSVTYSPSIYGEKRPAHNHRKDYFETLGHKMDRFAEGFETHYVQKGTMLTVEEVPTTPPDWVIAVRDNAKMICDMMAEVESKYGS